MSSFTCMTTYYYEISKQKEKKNEINVSPIINPLVHLFSMHTQCLKFTQKVAFNIASEASYVYILRWHKFIRFAKNGLFLAGFWMPEACGRKVLPERPLRTWIGEKCQNSNATFWAIFKHCETTYYYDRDASLLAVKNQKKCIIISWLR